MQKEKGLSGRWVLYSYRLAGPQNRKNFGVQKMGVGGGEKPRWKFLQRARLENSTHQKWGGHPLAARKGTIRAPTWGGGKTLGKKTASTAKTKTRRKHYGV